MGRWEELDKKRYSQSGTGPGEFGPDYSDRKKYQLGHGNESPSPVLKEMLESIPTGRNPLDARKQSQYVPHVIEPYDWKERKKDYE